MLCNQNRVFALLCLLTLAQLLLNALLPLPLQALSTALGIKHIVPPAKAAGIVTNKLLMMDIVVVGAGPERQKVVQRPGKLVAGVGVDGLEQAQHDPQVHGEDVEVAGQRDPQDGRGHGAEPQHHDLDRAGVLGGQPERRRVLVVDLVDVFVQERRHVHGAVRPVVPRVFQHEEDGDLVGHCVE